MISGCLWLHHFVWQSHKKLTKSGHFFIFRPFWLIESGQFNSRDAFSHCQHSRNYTYLERKKLRVKKIWMQEKWKDRYFPFSIWVNRIAPKSTWNHPTDFTAISTVILHWTSPILVVSQPLFPATFRAFPAFLYFCSPLLTCLLSRALCYNTSCCSQWHFFKYSKLA